MPDSFNKVCVIGLGEIGSAVFEDLHKHPTDPPMLYGIDINPKVKETFATQGFTVETSLDNIPPCDVYIITIFDSSKIWELIDSIPEDNNPLIIVESTIDPKDLPKLINMASQRTIITCPHRFNPRDPKHRVFNLDRIIGGVNQVSMALGVAFYSKFMDAKMLHTAQFHIAALSKVIENAYRFFDIVFAQELAKSCEARGIPYESIRSACNTKWNIELKEVHSGVGGKCLPKDMKFFNGYFNDNILTNMAQLLNERFVQEHLPW